MDAPRPADATLPTCPPQAVRRDLQSAQAIEACVDGLNRRSPLAQRDIVEWGSAGCPRLQIDAVTLAGGEFEARAGEGTIIDPAEVERSQFSVNARFVEFPLPRTRLLRLGAELAPGELSCVPGFAPLLGQPLAQRWGLKRFGEKPGAGRLG